VRELDDPKRLAGALREVREYTLAIYGHLDEAASRFPYLRSVNPPAWELAHVAWFHEHWCLRWAGGAPRESSRFPDADPLLNSALIPHAERWNRPEFAWPVVRDYMERVLDAQLERLERDPPEDRYFYLLSLYHEDMHDEAFLMSLQTLGLPEPRWAAPALPLPPAAPVAAPWVAFEGGTFELGSRPGPDFVFDNEKWAHGIRVAPFALAATAVTAGEYRAFVESGGYGERRWWTEAGWAWRLAMNALHPRHWVRDGARWLARRFDRLEPLDDSLAMVHVNAHEAEAYAAFAGARLPTEAEWEYAARSAGDARFPWGDAPRTAPEVNLDNRWRRPVAAAALHAGDTPRGLRQMLGNVWEWTSTPFGPYPGFAPDPYKEYSQPWFGDHRVLRGGSFATRSRLVHNRWRNFYTPERNDVFAGIRLARSPRQGLPTAPA